MASNEVPPATRAPAESHMKVAPRMVGPMLAAMRRQSGYRFIVETDRHGETAAWLVRAALRVL